MTEAKETALDSIAIAHSHLCDIYDDLPDMLESAKLAIAAYDRSGEYKDPIAREGLIVVKTALEHLAKHLIAADELIGTVTEMERPSVTDKRPRLSQRPIREDQK
ncbi:MAG: hypothetical protein [Caudoviricetes sp.]|nr:MAG: hypothetical protein [Caudoviricetes sp.]